VIVITFLVAGWTLLGLCLGLTDAMKGLPAQRLPLAVGVLLLIGAAYLAKPVA
jgi:hypothetical protein